MATKNINTDNISFINANLSANYPELSDRWQKLRGRALVYGFDKNYKNFTKSWYKNENTNRVFREIRRALGALKEIENNNDLSDEQKQKIKNDIRLTIDVELIFLDLKQQIKLAKDETQFRPEINEITLSLKSKTKAVRAILKESKMPEGLKQKSAPEIFRFYKRARKFNLDFDKYINYATTSRDVIQLAHHTAGIVDSAAQVSSMALQAIPALYAITVAATFILGAVRSWWNNQSNKKKAISTGMAVAAIGVIAISGLLPAVGVFITGALAVVGTYMDRIKPTIDLFRLIDTKQNELISTENKISRLKQSNALTIRLDQKDVVAIQHKLESYLAEADIKPADVFELRKLISDPKVTIEKLTNNALLQAATGAHHSNALKEFLINAAIKHADVIENDINTLKAQRVKSSTLATNGALSAVGAILTCIPTPPTIIAGVSILAFTTMVNLVLTYDLIPKTMNFVKNLFGSEKAKPAEEMEMNEFKPRLVSKNMHSVLKTGERKPTQETAYTPDNKSGNLFKKPREVAPIEPVMRPEPKRK